MSLSPWYDGQYVCVLGLPPAWMTLSVCRSFSFLECSLVAKQSERRCFGFGEYGPNDLHGHD